MGVEEVGEVVRDASHGEERADRELGQEEVPHVVAVDLVLADGLEPASDPEGVIEVVLDFLESLL